MQADEFEDLGFFWLPDDVNAERRVPGTLNVNTSGATTLKLFGLEEGRQDSLVSSFAHRDGEATRRILGATRERGFVTLDGCLRIESKMSAQTRGFIFNSATYLATWLFVGVLYEESESIRFSKVTFGVEGLDEWLALSGIEVDGDPRAGRATITFQKPEPLPLQGLANSEHGRIGFGYSFPSAWKETKEAHVSQSAYVELATEDWWTADEATRRAMWFRDFLRLATDQSVADAGLTGYSRDVTEAVHGGDERESQIRIMHHARDQGQAERNLLGPLMLFQRGDLADELQVCLARWFEMYSEYHQPFRLYFSAVDSARHSTANEKFRQFTEALETLDKALHGSARKDFSERVTRLTEPFADQLGLEESCGAFGQRVARTRNVFVHHFPFGDDDRPEGPDLIRLTYQCELLLIYHFVAVVTGGAGSAIEMISSKEAIAKRLRVIENR